MATESEYKQRDGLGYVKVTVSAESSVRAEFTEAPTEAGKIADPPLEHRRFLLLRNFFEDNQGTTNIYIGGPNVTTSNGYPLVNNTSGAPYKAERIVLNVSDGLAVYGVVLGPAAENFRTLELA
jgi:hypothetical protein